MTSGKITTTNVAVMNLEGEGHTCAVRDCGKTAATSFGRREGPGFLPACWGYLKEVLAEATVKHKAYDEEQRLAAWAEHQSEQVVMPAGLYYIGDPCYVLSEERWAELRDAMHPQYPDGGRNLDGIDPAAWTSQELSMMAMETCIGDGGYRDNESYEYGVDSGTIGAIQLAGASLLRLNSESLTYDTQVYNLLRHRRKGPSKLFLARLHLFTEGFACYWVGEQWSDAGRDLHFGDIVIHTD